MLTGQYIDIIWWIVGPGPQIWCN